MIILCKYPSLRVDKIGKLFTQYVDLSAPKPNQFWFIMDSETKGKIAACNSKIDEYDGPWDILMLISDDMIPKVKGWDQIIIDDMTKYYPDTDGVLFYNDGHNGRKLNTLAIMGRKYYERFGYIYNPKYKSLFADNEFMEVADALGKQTYIDRVIIEHQHPFYYPEKNDDLYRKNNGYYLQDKLTYERRKANGFYLSKNLQKL